MDANLPNHPYHSLQVPGDAPFILKPSPGNGWGAFATRRIARGVMILKEKPLFIIRKPHHDIMEEDVFKAFQQLTPSQKLQFLCIRDNGGIPFQRMTQVMAENCFAIPERNKQKSYGLFLLHSRINHSCLPNCNIPIPNGETVASFATRSIDVGEELTFCYNTDFQCRTRQDRHRALRFACDCKACKIGTPFQRLSDMRRTLIRGLQYLIHGVDLGGKRHDSASAIIVDPDLKKAAEDFFIPLSARLMYYLLIMILLEQEGLLDAFMVKRMNPGILQTMNFFRTESNITVAQLAMAQATWIEKFGIASRLYGKKDDNDLVFAVANALQQMR